jgi:MFS family permease
MRRLLLLVGAIVFVDSMFYVALTPLLPDYADRLELSKTGAGILAASYAAGALLGAIPGGIAAARWGVRPTVLLGLAGMTVTTFTFGLVDHIVLLDAARFVQGFASAFSWTGGLAWLVAAAPPERRGELIGAAMGTAIGGALFGPVLGGTASVVGTGWAFGAVAVASVGLALWAAATPASVPEQPQALRALFAALRDSSVLVGAWLVLLPGLLFSTLSVLAPLRLDELGFGALAIGAVYLVATGLEAVIAPVMGRVSDRIGRLTPLRVSLVAAAAVVSIVPWLDHSWLLAAFVVLAAISFGSFWAPAMALLSENAEARGLEHGYTFALVSLAWAPGAAGGAAVGGAVAEATSDAVPFLALALACVATLALLRRLQTPEMRNGRLAPAASPESGVT